MDEAELIPLEKAAERLEVSRATMWRWAREWNLTVYLNPRDRRQKLLSWEEIQEAMKPRPLGKCAA